jgi:phosphoglycolate phosphatase-like HAD superfamily hydrolase
VHLALEELGRPPERALMVGDTPDDILAGRAAGTLTVGVTTGVFDAEALAAAGADHVIPRLDELLGLIG